MFEDIDRISIEIVADDTSNATYRIASIEVVPEPSAFLHLGTALAGFFGLVVTRRCRGRVRPGRTSA